MQWASRPPSGGFSWKVLAGLILAAAAGIVLMMRTPDPLEAQAAKKGTVAVARPVAAGDVAPEAKVPRGRVYQSRRLMDTSGFSEILSFLRWAPMPRSRRSGRTGRPPRPGRWSFTTNSSRRPGNPIRNGWASCSRRSTSSTSWERPRRPTSCSSRHGPGSSRTTPWPSSASIRSSIIRAWKRCDAARTRTASCAGARARASCRSSPPPSIPTQPAPAWRSSTSPSTSSSSPTTCRVRWLLNLAHMTLGEYPQKVDPRFLIPLDHYLKSEFDIGKFRDIGHLARSQPFQHGWRRDHGGFRRRRSARSRGHRRPTRPSTWRYYRNAGDGTFEDRTEPAGLIGATGGLVTRVQTDYNNDGRMDLFISRGAWLAAIRCRQSLAAERRRRHLHRRHASRRACIDPGQLHRRVLGRLRQRRLARRAIPLREPVQPACITTGGTGRSRKSPPGPACGRTAIVTARAATGSTTTTTTIRTCSSTTCKVTPGCITITATAPSPTSRKAMGIDGPKQGFSCWAWDYDNDGWLDIFATCYDHSLADVVKGHDRPAAQRDYRTGSFAT